MRIPGQAALLIVLFLFGTAPALAEPGAPSLIGDLSISGTGSPNPVATGSTLTYQLSVTNSGPDAGQGVVATDTLPATVAFGSASPSQGSCSQAAVLVTCTLGTVASGAQATVTIIVTPTAAGTAADAAAVVASTLDTNLSNNATTITTTVTGATVATADVGLAGTASPDPVGVGHLLTYGLTVNNGGPLPAAGVTLTDTLPAGGTFGTTAASQGGCTQAAGVVSCGLGIVPAAGQATITITVTPTLPGVAIDAAAVTATTLDPNPANNALAFHTTVSTDTSPSPYRPDALIVNPHTHRWLGEDIYNGTGAHQTARLGARPGQKRVFHIEVENDGTALDSFVVRRWGRRPVGVGLRFFSGGRDVTALVASHSFVLRSLAPGATRRMRLVVRVFRRARLGTVRAWFVKFRSVQAPTRRDVVRIGVHILRRSR